MLRVSHLSYSYNKKNVIDDISFALKEGQINILLGPNGVGKSTILKCLTGILKVKEGDIYLNDKNYKELKSKEIAKNIAYVEQNSHIENLSVYEVVMLGRTPYTYFIHSQKDEDRVNEVIKEIGIEELKYRNISTLSGGERQKVMIALALASDSKVLLLDEPTSNLDIKSSLMILNLIKKLSLDNKLTILISMHDISLAYQYGDYFLLMKDKHIRYMVDKKELNEEIIKDIYDIKVDIDNNQLNINKENYQ